MSKKGGVAHFRMHGEDLVRIARSLWADELEVVKAIRLIARGLNAPEYVAMQILTGEATLVGVNHVELVPDDTKITEHGNKLAAEDVFGRLKKKADDAKFEMEVTQQMACGSIHAIGSPWGRGYVPQAVYKKLQKEEWTWDQVRPYFNTDFHILRNTRYNDEEIEEQEINFRQSVGLLDAFMKQEKDRNELADVEPEPAADFSSENGWIDREGNFYTCGMLDHDFLAKRLGRDVKDLEKTHIRVSVNPASNWRSPIQFVGRRPTKKQRDAVWDWCQLHGHKFPEEIFK